MNTYPQSSCPSEGCTPNLPYFVQPDNYKPCSLALDPQFNCTTTQIYKQNFQPAAFSSPKHINLNNIGPRFSNEYTPVSCNVDNYCKLKFIGTNQKLIDAPRAQLLALDRPHLTSEVAVGDVERDEIYTPQFAKYGKGYTNYHDINAGQIQYYIDPDIAPAYHTPNFVDKALVSHTITVDPMGVVRPQYNRITTKKYDWDPCNKDNCDSFTHDQLEFRQELMEQQMSTINEQRYSSRWYS